LNESIINEFGLLENYQDEFLVEEESCFVFSDTYEDYYKIDSKILNTKKDVFLSKEMSISKKHLLPKEAFLFLLK